LQTVAPGSYKRENKLKNVYWTYSLEEVCKGLRLSYRAKSAEVNKHSGIEQSF
jgi:hypothetical protein